MEDVDYLILGAGPSGLAVAHGLLDQGATSVVVLDQADEAGGLCRSQVVDGAAIDTGGGHFLDVKRQRVLDLVFRFMPRSEWKEHDRIARIRLRGSEVDHPFESNLWQLPVDDQVDYCVSIAAAGCIAGKVAPELFEDWIRWKLGDRIADDYMLPYNRKIWSMPVNDLGTYWLEKLPDVSFPETLESCLRKAPAGKLPAHGKFLYPTDLAAGYGEVWRRMGSALGDRLRLKTPVTSIDPASKVVNGGLRYRTLITTVPWPVWQAVAAIPTEVDAAISRLRQVAIDVDYREESCGSAAHWIYEPDEGVDYHRILARENFLEGARGYWTETNAGRSVADKPADRHFHNPYAYPVNTRDKRESLAVVHGWAAPLGIKPLGRWGNWEHINSDVAVDQALALADGLIGEGA